jgi:hypothetical protein
MTTVDAGTNAFPTTVQLANGVYLYKSSTASTTDRPWRAWSDGKIIHFTVQPTSTTWGTNSGAAFHFGDFVSYLPGDAYNTMIWASATAFVTGSSHATTSVSSGFSATGGLYFARSYTAAAGALNGGRVQEYGASSSFSAGPLPYPDPVRGGLSLCRSYLIESSPAAYRGYMQGLWGAGHQASTFAPAWGDTLSGATGSPLAGKTFDVTGNYNFYPWLIESSDNWE